jgi:GNAT superfamily N-acetyltransferase
MTNLHFADPEIESNIVEQSEVFPTILRNIGEEIICNIESHPLAKDIYFSIRVRASHLLDIFVPNEKFYLYSGISFAYKDINSTNGIAPIISGLFIPEELRGHGIASKLVSSWEIAFANNGYKGSFFANVIKEKELNTETFSLFQKLGYQLVDSEKLPGLMVKNITENNLEI